MEVAKNFKEAQELMKTPPTDVNIGKEYANTGILTSLTLISTIPHRIMLSDLTGIDLMEDDALYDYLAKSLDLDADDVMKYTLALIVTIADNPSEIVEKTLHEARKEMEK